MNDLYGPLDEKKKKRKKRKKAGSESSKESSLRDWFGRKGAKGKKKGWVDCNAPDGKGGYKSCGRSSGEKRKKYPACRPTPGACKERGKGKSWGKKAKKKSKKNEVLYMDLEQIIQEELEKIINEGIGTGALIGGALMAAAMSGDNSSPKEVVKDTMSDEEKRRIAAELVKKIQQEQGFQALVDQWKEADNLKRNKPAAATTASMDYLKSLRPDRSKLEEIVKEELEAVLDEKRKKKKKKKKKKKAKRDACYHKVKSRYSVWPSAYASGALVKCRRVGAKNWGNSKKESLEIEVQNEIELIIQEGILEEKKKKKKKSAKDRMKCNSSRRIRKGEPGYGKKKFVVKACEGGTEKIIRYGDANMEIKKDSPARRKSFRARHNCKNPGSKLKARYWSCKKW